jgi:hypothetical protein
MVVKPVKQSQAGGDGAKAGEAKPAAGGKDQAAADPKPAATGGTQGGAAEGAKAEQRP